MQPESFDHASAPRLLATKLYLPRARPNLVPRPRLQQRLDAGRGAILTLVCAPAGFGKSTLVAAWLRQTARRAAWLSLDAADSDPAVFLRYLVAALQQLAPGAGVTTLALLQLAQPPPLETLLTALLNDLVDVAEESTLVLDDYHVLQEPQIHQAIGFLIEHLPAGLHVVIATREDPPLPLARLRARHQIVELRVEQLRFTADEAAVFLTEVMGLPLSHADVLALERRTEGWIAGLQLAALAMQDREDLAGFIAGFTGGNRFIVDYLADEVLNRQPAHIQRFLLCTSILDQMCASLCDAVLGVGPATLDDHQGVDRSAYSQLLLEQFERANLFVIPLDAERQWYRYHHLFVEVLRERLRRGTTNTESGLLHRRASAWYAQAGFVTEAIQHALAGRAFDEAAVQIARAAPTMMQRSELTRLRVWLDALPPTVLQTRPLLGLYYGWILLLSGQPEQAAARLHSIETLLTTQSAETTSEIYGYAAALRAYLMRETGDVAETVALSQQALVHLPEHETLLRAMVSLNLAIVHYLAGEFPPATQLLTEILAAGQTAQQMANTLSATYLYSQLLLAQGELQHALQLCRDELDLVAQRGWQDSPSVGFLHVAFGNVLCQRNELDAAATHLERGIALGLEGGHPHIVIAGSVWLAWLRQGQGDVAGSDAALRLATQIVERYKVSPYWPLPSVASYQARIWIRRGDTAAASDWARASGILQVAVPTAYHAEQDYLTLARLRIAQGELVAAEALLDHLYQAATRTGRNGSRIEILTLQAMAHAAQQREDAACLALKQALALAKPAGFVRVFLDEGAPLADLLQLAQTRGIAPNEVAVLLSALRDSDARPPATAPMPSHPDSTLVEPLTTREREVLGLIAAGASNAEIAQQLVVSIGTVKKHTANIFGKLQVQSRTQAIARARELGLL